MGILRIMSRRGDDQFSWDMRRAEENDPEAVAAIHEAERIFREQRERGATAFRAGQGRAFERINEFDPTAEQIVLIPMLVGG